MMHSMVPAAGKMGSRPLHSTAAHQVWPCLLAQGHCMGLHGLTRAEADLLAGHLQPLQHVARNAVVWMVAGRLNPAKPPIAQIRQPSCGTRPPHRW